MQASGPGSFWGDSLGFYLAVPLDVQWQQHILQFLRALDDPLSIVSSLFLKNQCLMHPLSVWVPRPRPPGWGLSRSTFLAAVTARRRTESFCPCRETVALSPPQLLHDCSALGSALQFEALSWPFLRKNVWLSLHCSAACGSVNNCIPVLLLQTALIKLIGKQQWQRGTWRGRSWEEKGQQERAGSW